MTLVLVLSAWIFVALLVVGLCAAARAGDLVPAPTGRRHREPTDWEPSESVEINAHANAQAARPAEAGSLLLHGSGVAA